MKTNNIHTIDSTKDQRPLALLAVCLVIIALHLLQTSLQNKELTPDKNQKTLFTWQKSNPEGEGLYRLQTRNTDKKFTQAELPNQLKPIFFRPISINKADRQLITTLPGIGKILADRIISYREIHGNFKSPEDLLAVKGIGSGKINKINKLLDFN